jgi:large subunit ribosomal protein L23
MTEKGIKKFLTGLKKKTKIDDKKMESVSLADKKEKIDVKEEKKKLPEIKTDDRLKMELKTDTTVLVRPVITEKATAQQAVGCYTFEINNRANKFSIMQAIKEIYHVEPLKINIIKTKGKKVRYGRSSGTTKSKKKALVFLKKNDKIEFVKK